MELNIVTKEELEIMGQRLIDAFAALLREGNQANANGRLYSNNEACAYLKVCSKTLQNYRDNGLLRFTQIGRKIYYSQSDLTTFLETYKKETFLNQLKNRRHA